MSANIWRVPAPVVKKGQAFSVIQDNGRMRRAFRASNGNYLFSEMGAGTMPMAIVGSRNAVYAWLKLNQNRGIENQLRDLPEIYAGYCPYVPGKNFKGLFPVNDVSASLISKVANAPAAYATASGFGPESINPVKLGKAIGKIVKNFGGSSGSSGNTRPNAHDAVYMKFSYLRERGTSQIGEGFVSFGEVKDWFYDQLYPN